MLTPPLAHTKRISNVLKPTSCSYNSAGLLQQAVVARSHPARASMFRFLSRRASKFAHSEPSSSSAGASTFETAANEQGESQRLSGEGAANNTTARTTKQLRLRSAATCLPHPDKVHYGGEDAYFISNMGGGALGVADGVGGWAESGVNPAEYSRTFMRLACAYLEGRDIFTPTSDAAPSRPAIDPRGSLNAAHQNTKVAGSATACVMQLDQSNQMLTAANLGDSGFFVYRAGRVAAKSRPLQHYFDCPLQFGAYPEYVEATDTADMAELYQIPLEAGDVIVAGSDGLWDNCFEAEVMDLLPREAGRVQDAANRIASMARAHAEDPDFPSPYTREALSQGLDLAWWDKLLGASIRNGRLQLKQLTGGKLDDITVLVSLVEEVNPSEDGYTSRGASPLAKTDSDAAYTSPLTSPTGDDAPSTTLTPSPSQALSPTLSVAPSFKSAASQNAGDEAATNTNGIASSSTKQAAAPPASPPMLPTSGSKGGSAVLASKDAAHGGCGAAAAAAAAAAERRRPAAASSAAVAAATVEGLSRSTTLVKPLN